MDIAQCLWLVKRLFTTLHAESRARCCCCYYFHSSEVGRRCNNYFTGSRVNCPSLTLSRHLLNTHAQKRRPAVFCLTATTFQLTQMPGQSAATAERIGVSDRRCNTASANNRGEEEKTGAIRGSRAVVDDAATVQGHGC